MKNLIYLFTAIFSFVSLVNAQDSYKIKVKIEGVKDTNIYLANYLGKKLYYYDTTRVDKNGYGVFEKTNTAPGMFAIVAPGSKYFEVIVTEPEIELETKLDDLVGGLQIKKSVENKIFYDYISYISDKRNEKTTLSEEISKLDAKNDEKLIAKKQEQLLNIDTEVLDYQKNLAKTHSDKLVGKLVKMTLETEVPDDIKEDRSAAYYYYKSHYFDNVDLKDERLVRSALYHNKLERFFNSVVIKVPDSICQEATNLISKMNKGGDMFKYNVHYITSTYEKSNIMGMDAVVVCMFDNYYRTGDAFWMTDDQLEKFREKVDGLKPLLLGKVTPNIILQDTSESKWINLHEDIKNDYVILYFWDPTCGHCKKELPKMKKFYDSIKNNTDIDLEVFAVCTKLETDGWKEYITSNKLNWINVSDNPEVHNNPEKYLYSKETTLSSLNFRQTYDIFSTPRGFLLDKNKVIKAKQFEVENLNDIMTQLLKIEESQQKEK